MYRVICMWQDGNQYTEIMTRWKDVVEYMTEFTLSDKRDIVVITVVKVNG